MEGRSAGEADLRDELCQNSTRLRRSGRATMTAGRTPFRTRAAWRGQDLAGSNAWVRSLGAREQGEIATALDASRRVPLFEITKHDFPLAATADFLAEVSDELENGLGMVRISGIEVERHTED